MKVAFRVDASLAIGTGHLSRCRVLAERLQKDANAEILFVLRDLLPESVTTLRQQGFAVAELESPATSTLDPEGPSHRHWLPVSRETDASQTIAAIRERGWTAIDWMVVDHYALDAAWETQLREIARSLLAIDDLADREHDVDVLLDQNLRVDAGRAYDALVPSHARILLGPRYALLAEQFARGDVSGKPDARAKRIFVCFGGADEANATGLALGALCEPLVSDCPVDVVISSRHPRRADIEALVVKHGNAELHVDTGRVAELMRNADIGIGGGGVMTWERCATGLPSIAWPIAKNQQPVLHAAAKAGVLLLPDVPEKPAILAAHVAVLRDNAALRASLAQTAQQVCDGHGAGRVAKILQTGGELRLRPAAPEDSARVLAWRNHPSVRRTAFNSEPISEKDHARWFSSVLADASRDLLIGELDQSAVGVVRFDVAGSQAEVSIYLAPEAQGCGLGATLLGAADAWIREARPEVEQIVAKVRAGNEASERAFAQAGYRQDHSVWLRSLNRNREEKT